MTQIELIVQNNPETLEIVDEQIEIYNQDKPEDQKIRKSGDMILFIC
jgi:hypothetical protein